MHTPIAQQQPNHQCSINTVTESRAQERQSSAVLIQVMAENRMRFDCCLEQCLAKECAAVLSVLIKVFENRFQECQKLTHLFS